MQKTKVSYLIALYNKEDFIEECIDSVLKESTKDIEIEICIVDDGSSDRSLEIVQSRYNKNPNVKIFSFDKNKGKCAAYNKAYEMSSGEYLCIFGADDIVVPNRTSNLLREAKRFEKSAYGVVTKFNNNIDSYTKVINQIENINEVNVYLTTSFEDIVMQNSLSGGAGMLLREHAKDIFPIPEHLKFEDWWVSYHLVRNNWVVATSAIVTIYRIHGNNDNATIDPNYLAYKKDYHRHYDYLKEFLRIADSDTEQSLINKSLLLRDAFFGKRLSNLQSLKNLGIDKYSFKIIIFYIFGSKNYYTLRSLLYNRLKKT